MNRLLHALINRYKKIQQTRFLDAPLAGPEQLAIVGAGQHAITHLYPCLWHLGIPVKKICTRHEPTAKKAAARFPGCTGTADLGDILQDPAIQGVIVCTQPKAHPEICSRLLSAGKQVFVEKPLGYSSSELAAVQQLAKDKILMVGLQRRFSPLVQKLSSLINNPVSYQYRFLVGAYPEGDPVYEVFIHSIDCIVFLLGKPSILHCSVRKAASGLTCHLVLDHGACIGHLELSTNYSWKNCTETLDICQPDGIIRASYPAALSLEKKQPALLGIPFEKISGQGQSQEIFLQPNDFNPVAANNSLVKMGFYPALELFVRRLRTSATNQQEQLELLAVYEILDQIALSAGMR